MTVVDALLPLIVGFGVTGLAVPGIITLAHRKRWYDERNHRKIHIADTPRIGGIGIFVGFLAAIAATIALLVPGGESAAPGWRGRLRGSARISRSATGPRSADRRPGAP